MLTHNNYFTIHTVKKAILLISVAFLILNCDKDETSIPIIFEGDIILRSQTEVDDFGSKGYTKITGNLIISSNYYTPINTLKELHQINFVEGDLFINSNSSLNNLNGLNNIIKIGGNLAIHSNDNLTGIDGLYNLTTIDGGLG